MFKAKTLKDTPQQLDCGPIDLDNLVVDDSPDLATMSEVIQFGDDNRWRLRQINHPYGFAFE